MRKSGKGDSNNQNWRLNNNFNNELNYSWTERGTWWRTGQSTGKEMPFAHEPESRHIAYDTAQFMKFYIERHFQCSSFIELLLHRIFSTFPDINWLFL